MSDIVERITAYLSLGGLFNPELADHDAVRDMIIDCRGEITALRAEVERLNKSRNRWGQKYNKLLEKHEVTRAALEGKRDE